MPRIHVNPGGFCVAATYVLIVILVFAVTAATTKPGNVGYDWIPFVLLSMPWYGMPGHPIGFGLLANVGVMYLLGVLFHNFWRRVIGR